MPQAPDISFLLNKPPEEIIRWFKDKDYKITWNWRDMQRQAHLRAFTVAKAMNLDVLKSIRGEVENALENGITLREFRNTLEPRLKKLGWWGKRTVIDPETGNPVKVQLGSPWRLKTIYRTNLQTSYMRGRYRHQKRAAGARPWWMYDARDDGKTRASHAAKDNIVKRHDSPFWDYAYPPNGWGCRCRVRSFTDRGLENRGLKPHEGDLEPFAGEGWNYNPGADPWRGITPTPPRSLNGLYNMLPDQLPQSVVPNIEDLPRLPFNKADLLPQTKSGEFSNEDYARAFLGVFDADINKPIVFTDKAGMPLAINKGLLQNKKGKWKVTKRGREQYLKFLAKGIKDPAEIWLTWIKKGDDILLSRRYITLFEDPKGQVKGYAAFDWVQGEWKGVTTFSPDELDYLDGQRKGYRIYAK